MHFSRSIPLLGRDPVTTCTYSSVAGSVTPECDRILGSRSAQRRKMSVAPTAAPTDDDYYSSDRRMIWLVAVPVCWLFLGLIFYCWYNFPPVRRPPGTPTSPHPVHILRLLVLLVLRCFLIGLLHMLLYLTLRQCLLGFLDMFLLLLRSHAPDSAAPQSSAAPCRRPCSFARNPSSHQMISALCLQGATPLSLTATLSLSIAVSPPCLVSPVEVRQT